MMTECVLRVTSSDDGVERLASRLWTAPVMTWKKGAVIVPGRESANGTHRDSGLSLLVAGGRDGDRSQQFAAAAQYLRNHGAALTELREVGLVREAVLDFGMAAAPDVIARFVRIPLDLIDVCQESRVSIELSFYLTSEANG